MRIFNANLQELDNLDLQQAFSISSGPATQALGSAQKGPLKAALRVGRVTGVALAAPSLEIMQVSERPPTVTRIDPSRVPVGMASRPSSIITIGLGVQVSAFVGVGFTGETGFYGSTSREFGVYVSGGAGWWTNVGSGVGPVLTIIFGPPSDFRGVALGIGADIIAAPPLVSFGGMLLFSAPPTRYIGVAVGFSAGLTVLPVDLTIQISKTATKPLVKLR